MLMGPGMLFRDKYVRRGEVSGVSGGCVSEAPDILQWLLGV